MFDEWWSGPVVHALGKRTVSSSRGAPGLQPDVGSIRPSSHPPRTATSDSDLGEGEKAHPRAVNSVPGYSPVDVAIHNHNAVQLREET